MKRLEDLSWWQRAILLIVIVAIILLAMMLFLREGGEYAHGEEIYVVPERFHDDVLTLDRRALDDAYISQGQHLFRTWITDRLHDPSGIDRGLSKARQGYVLARERIEKRSK